MKFVYGLVLPTIWFVSGMLVLEVFGRLDMNLWVWFILLLPLLGHGVFHLIDMISTSRKKIKQSAAIHHRVHDFH
jgi:hypothetical protein